MPGLPTFAVRRGRTRLVGTLALAVLVVVGAACLPVKPTGPPPPPPPPSQYCHPSTPTTPAQYQAAFDGLRAANAGLFVAADGGLPTPLPGGRILWFFGDTVLGRWKPGGPVDPYLGLDRNSWVVQTGRCFKPTREPIPDLPNGHWIWPTAAIVRSNSELLVFGQRMRPVGGTFPFDYVETDVIRFSLPGLTRISGPQKLPPSTANRNYGETVLLGEDGYVYAYGRERQPKACGFCPPLDHHYVARVLLANFPNGPWEHWNDDLPDMVGDASEEFTENPFNGPDPMLFDGDDAEPPAPDPIYTAGEGPVAAFPVLQTSATTFLGSAMDYDTFPTDIYAWHAEEPSGPWRRNNANRAANVPNYSGNHFAYGGRVLLNLPNGPVALWSTNHTSFDAVLANPQLYKVLFAGVNQASLTPPPVPTHPPPGP